MALDIATLNRKVSIDGTKLDLSAASTPKLQASDIPFICTYLTEHKDIITLDISYNDLGPDAAKALSKALTGNTTLTTLIAGNNNFGHEGAQYIPAIPNLTTLDIRSNKLGPQGAQYIAGCPNLKTLNVTDNNLGHEGAQYIAAIPNLISLDISCNQLGDEGAYIFAQHPTITKLDMSNNNIGPKGIKALASNKILTSLIIVGTEIGLEGVKYLASNITLNTLGVAVFDNGGRDALAQRNPLVRANLPPEGEQRSPPSLRRLCLFACKEGNEVFSLPSFRS